MIIDREGGYHLRIVPEAIEIEWDPSNFNRENGFKLFRSPDLLKFSKENWTWSVLRDDSRIQITFI